ncbi:hypothetical protein QYM36_004930 [Artemia franciscana]|uniref:Uncharacterized protein n=1 Tax=Artemia franciscana TaxID=6661 RepID=A0AA88I6J2_ARTSF|nr:hypothetical protein QYM36_004930 [Artemia franciscana]
MTRRLGSLWHCPTCKQKGSGTQGITPSEIKDIIKSEIRCSFSTIETKLQDKFEKLLKPISDQLTQIEKEVSAKCSVEGGKKHANTSLKVEFDNLSEKLKNEIKSKETANDIVEDLVMKQKNLVVFGLQEDPNCSTKKSDDPTPQKQTLKYNYTKGDYESFRNFILSLCITEQLRENKYNVNEVFELIHEALVVGQNKFIPTIAYSWLYKNRQTLPREILQAISEKNYRALAKAHKVLSYMSDSSSEERDETEYCESKDSLTMDVKEEGIGSFQMLR